MTAIRSRSARPRSTRWSAAGQHVVERGVPAVHVVGVHELAAEAGRAADVRREHGDAGRGQRLVLRVEGRPLLRLRAAVQAQRRRRRSASGARYSQPVSGSPSRPGEPLQRRHHQRAVGHLRAVGHPVPGVRAGVEVPQLARPLRPLDAEDHARPVAGEHRRGGDQAGQAGDRRGRPGRGVEQLDLAGARHVPDQQQEPAGVVGVHPLEVGVVPGGEGPRLAAPPVGPERQPDQLPAGQADVGGEVDVHRAGVVLGRRPDERPPRSSRWRRAGAR